MSTDKRSETPRTDAVVVKNANLTGWATAYVVLVTHAEQLERELAEAEAELERRQAKIMSLLSAERDNLRANIERIAEGLDRALGDSDVTHIEDDDELRQRYPAHWACAKLNRLLQSAPNATRAIGFGDGGPGHHCGAEDFNPAIDGPCPGCASQSHEAPRLAQDAPPMREHEALSSARSAIRERTGKHTVDGATAGQLMESILALVPYDVRPAARVDFQTAIQLAILDAQEEAKQSHEAPMTPERLEDLRQQYRAAGPSLAAAAAYINGLEYELRAARSSTATLEGYVLAVEENGAMRVYGPQYLTREGAGQDAKLPKARGQKFEVWEVHRSPPSASATRGCPYCSSDNAAIRDTYFDQNCEGCCKRMGAMERRTDGK